MWMGRLAGGGHTRAMLAAMSPSGSLHAFDMDPVLPTMHCKFFTDQMKLTTLGQEQCVTMHLYNHSHFSISFFGMDFHFIKLDARKPLQWAKNSMQVAIFVGRILKVLKVGLRLALQKLS